MKKILFAMLVAVATTFSFTSCEDVPEAYQLPTAGAGSEGAGGEEGAGTIDNPYTVNAIKKGGVTGTTYLKAYIVGFVPEKAISEAKFSAEGCEATSNVIVAASADETNVNNVMAIQLPIGAVRDGVNLKDNPTNLKQEVILYGNVENYFGQVGMKSVTWAKIGDKEFGTKPDGGGEVAGEAKGTGTLADPFNSVAANNEAKKLASGAVSEQGYYIKGKVVSIKEQFSAQYGNASFYISDDGKAGGQFLVFRSLYFGNQKWTEGQSTIKEGDEVVVYGKLTNYMGNTLETAQNTTYLVSLNGKTEGTEGGNPDTPNPDQPGTDQPGGGNTGGDATVGDVFEYDVTSAGFTEDTKLTEITLTNGLTITFDGGGNSSAPVFNLKFKNFRFYPKNTMKFNSTKKIASIKFLCDKGQTTICNASGDISSTSGTTSIDGNYLVISGINEQNFTLTNVSTKTKEPSQLRFTKIIITFAK